MSKLLSASRLIELYTDNADGYQSTTDKLLSNLFDGFIFYVAVVVFIISVLIITAKYRRKPTLGKRKSLTATTVLLTVFDALLLLFKVDFSDCCATLTTISRAITSHHSCPVQANMLYIFHTI